VAALAVPAVTAQAEVFPVTSAADSGPATLRSAVESSNALGGPDAIAVEVTGTIQLLTALPSITDDVVIDGPGDDLLSVRRNAVGSFRIFDIGAGADTTLQGLTVTNGLAASGAGIDNSSGSLTLIGVTVTGNEAAVAGDSQAVSRGGGISSSGPLTLREATVSNNISRASNGSSQTVAQSGGISAVGPATIERSTVSGNASIASSTGTQVVAQSGGLSLFGEPTTVDRSTISGNSSNASNGALQTVAQTAGLQASDGVTLTGSTVTGNMVNSTGSVGRANVSIFGSHVVRDTIISNPIGSPESCTAPLTSGGFNIDDGTSCGLSQPTDLSNTSPGLDPILRDNGGPTLTHGLAAGGAAIDRGNAFGATADQRGSPRPSDFASTANAAGGDGSDIGAFEFPAPTIIVDRLPPPRDVLAPNTRIDKAPPRKTFNRIARFRFSSTEAGSRFECKLDGRRYRPCQSPTTYNKVSRRKHTFQVRAIDLAGNVDATPAIFKWRVKQLPRRSQRH
jgi:hypothetical protein